MNIRTFFSYYNRNNRAVENGFYPVRTSDGRQNPIGRATTNCLNNLVVFPLERIDPVKKRKTQEYISVDNSIRFDELDFLPEYSGVSPEVWRALISLHDHEEFWGESSLNESGRAFLNKIVHLHERGQWP